MKKKDFSISIPSANKNAFYTKTTELASPSKVIKTQTDEGLEFLRLATIISNAYHSIFSRTSNDLGQLFASEHGNDPSQIASFLLRFKGDTKDSYDFNGVKVLQLIDRAVKNRNFEDTKNKYTGLVVGTSDIPTEIESEDITETVKNMKTVKTKTAKNAEVTA